MHHYKQPLALLLLAVMALPCWAQKGKEASTPEEAIKLMAAALKDPDFDAWLAQHPRLTRQYYDRSLDLDKLFRSLESALDAKFGKDPKAQPRPTPQEAWKQTWKDVKSLEVAKKTEKGKDAVVLQVKITQSRGGKDQVGEVTYLALKEKDGWKVTPIDPRLTTDEKAVQKLEEFYAAHLKQLKTAEDVYNKFIKEVKDGKYKSRAEVQEAFKAAFTPSTPPAKDKKEEKER